MLNNKTLKLKIKSDDQQERLIPNQKKIHKLIFVKIMIIEINYERLFY